MKKLTVVLMVFCALTVLPSAAVQADPRMETNNDFCHFILDPEDGDNEVFVADCGSVITVTLKDDLPALKTEESCDTSNYEATGYSQAVKVVPALAAPLRPGQRLVFTSKDSEYKCYMKESNGRTYRSERWRSSIRVSEKDDMGFVKVYYSLMCI